MSKFNFKGGSELKYIQIKVKDEMLDELRNVAVEHGVPITTVATEFFRVGLEEYLNEVKDKEA